MITSVPPSATLARPAAPITPSPLTPSVNASLRVSGRRRGGGYALAVVAALGGLFLVGYAPRRARQAALTQAAAAAATELPRVIGVRPTPSRPDRSLLLPGSIEPLETAQVHSRASGYVSEWLADMGDRVEAGQLLARLDTPELDREIEQARATLARADASILQTKATAEYSASTERRYAALAPDGLDRSLPDPPAAARVPHRRDAGRAR